MVGDDSGVKSLLVVLQNCVPQRFHSPPFIVLHAARLRPDPSRLPSLLLPTPPFAPTAPAAPPTVVPDVPWLGTGQPSGVYGGDHSYYLKAGSDTIRPRRFFSAFS